MRILLITGSLPPMKCGIGDYTAQLAETLGRRSGVTVGVLTDVAAQPVPTGRSYEVLPVAHGWKMSDLPRIVRTVRRWRPDIVHTQYPTQGYGLRKLPFVLPLTLALFRFPIVQTWHEYYRQSGIVQIKGSLLNLANALLPGGLIVVRPNYKETMSGWYRWLIRHKQFRFIPNASVVPVAVPSDADRSAIRARFVSDSRALIAYFGFVYPAKGIERLFDIADPARHHLVLICDLVESDPYHQIILNRIRAADWADCVTVTGFQPAEEVSRLLAAADAAVFPFREGGGKWNTSLQGALAQGTFVVTTSREQHGYDATDNIYYARPDDVADMRQALNAHSGQRAIRTKPRQWVDWDTIADDHLSLYESVRKRRPDEPY